MNFQKFSAFLFFLSIVGSLFAQNDEKKVISVLDFKIPKIQKLQEKIEYR